MVTASILEDRRGQELVLDDTSLPLRVVEVPENMIGDVVDIGTGRRLHEYYAFRQPAPRQMVADDLLSLYHYH